MKKSFVLLLTLLLVFTGTAYYAQGELLKEKDQLHYTEKVLYGDKSVVEGVTVETNLQYRYQLYWENLYTIGEKPIEQTKYTFYPNVYVDQNFEYAGSLNFMLDGTDIMLGNDYSKGQDYYGLQIAVKELYDNTPAGTENSATVYLKDYMDYYSFMMDMEFPFTNEEESFINNDYSRYYVSKSELREDIAALEKNGNNEKELKKLKAYLKDIETFEEFFKIPVLEKEVYKIAIAKDEDGVVIGMGDSHANGGSSTGDIDIPDAPDVEGADSFSFGIQSVFDNGDCYFTFEPHTTRGELVDVSQIPGGYGIYHFTYDSKKGTIDLSDLKMVFPLSIEQNLTEIKMDANGENLLLFTTDEKAHYMSVIDKETMTLVETFMLGDSMYYMSNWVYEDYIVVVADKLMVFERNQIGSYTQALAVDREILQENAIVENLLEKLDWDTTFDWNGETLLMANRILRHNNEQGYFADYTCDFYVAAVGDKGCLYYAEYESSLSDVDGYHSSCHFDTDKTYPIRIRWN